DLAPLAVGPADYGNLAHARVREQNLLDLARIDIGAAGDHHVLGAVFEREIAVRIERADVAGVQPAAAQGARARLCVAPVAGHDAGATAEDFAGLARRERPVVLVRHHHLDTGKRPPGRGETLAPARMLARGDVLLRQHRDRHRALALAVDLHKARAKTVERSE